VLQDGVWTQSREDNLHTGGFTKASKEVVSVAMRSPKEEGGHTFKGMVQTGVAVEVTDYGSRDDNFFLLCNADTRHTLVKTWAANYLRPVVVIPSKIGDINQAIAETNVSGQSSYVK
jgi:hypothetical protein